MTGIAIPMEDIPEWIQLEWNLRTRQYNRGGQSECRFFSHDKQPILPVWIEGEFRLFPWGNRLGKSRSLPKTGLTFLATVEGLSWQPWQPERILIPCRLGYCKGVWFRIQEGVQGILAKDEIGNQAAYLLCEPATRYYRVMTRCEYMPCLIDERI